MFDCSLLYVYHAAGVTNAKESQLSIKICNARHVPFLRDSSYNSPLFQKIQRGILTNGQITRVDYCKKKYKSYITSVDDQNDSH